MPLTPEQHEQVRQAKERGEGRCITQFTAQQHRMFQEAVEQELAGKEENIAHFRKVMAAAQVPGFFGDVRRAILLSRPSIPELVAHIGVDPRRFSDFQAGEAELSAAELDRLIEALGLRLTQEIPR